MVDIAFDMETGDPDDAFTLCILSTHPLVNLIAVTVTPGSDGQIGVVREILRILGKNVPIGFRKSCNKQVVSEFHYKWLGRVEDAKPDAEGWVILTKTLEDFPDAILLTGAPLHNIHALFTASSSPLFKKWVCQGGFAGDSVVPEEFRLEKFRGLETCPTFNLNGNPQAALALIETDRIRAKTFVSKNVCHGVVWDPDMHKRMRPYKNNYAGISMVFDAMEMYLRHKPAGKAFHDPLAACVAIDDSICQFRPVEFYREKGRWGSKIVEGSSTRITVSVDRTKFESVLGYDVSA